eukprot:3355264-Amphidinium_carterae.1
MERSKCAGQRICHHSQLRVCRPQTCRLATLHKPQHIDMIVLHPQWPNGNVAMLGGNISGGHLGIVGLASLASQTSPVSTSHDVALFKS